MALPYTLYKSDPTKYSQKITVPVNGTNDTDTSLTFIGPNAPSFGTAVNEDFLYLLENFANSTPPLHPTEGQLWYDTSNDTLTGKKLKVYDNINWNPVNGIWQQAAQPSGTVNTGDIWVNTAQGQLFITLDGLTWNLVGPTYSSVLKTGSYPEVITDISGAEHRVIKNYIDDNVVEIIANTSFTPNPPILGFSTGLAPGLNLSSVYNSTLNATAKLANALTLANGTSVSGNNLVRTDIDSSINATLSARKINVGSSAGGGIAPWAMEQISGNATFSNPKPNGRFSFKVTTTSTGGIPIPVDVLTIDGAGNFGGGVGIGLSPSSSPAASLDVNGEVYIREKLNLTTSSVAISSSGEIISPKLTVYGTSTFKTVRTTGTTYISGPILPTTNTVDLGTDALPLRTVYSNEFVGHLDGNVTGSASSLTNVVSWKLSGQVRADGFRFYGQNPGSQGFVFNSTLTNAAIVDQPQVTNAGLVSTSTYLLVSTQNELKKILKTDLFADLIQSLVPAGTIFPFAGLTPPSGYLLCDGLYVSASRFAQLFAAIGYTYGKGSGTISEFALPDLRSRSVIGFDDMNNNSVSSTLGVPGSRAGRTDYLTPNKGLASVGSAPLVTGQTDVTTGTTAVQYYHAMNYIIKT